MFADRIDAGNILAEKLAAYRAAPGAAPGAPAGGRAAVPSALVLGIPRGGVVVAAEVARELGLVLDVAIAAKVGAPGNDEYAVGAVAADGAVTANPAAGFADAAAEQLAGPARAKVAHSLATFRAGLPPLDVVGRTVIVVDDGLATGLTAIAAIRWLRRAGAGRIVLAVPVASRSAARTLTREVDELIAVSVPEGFSAVGQFYTRFGQTEDAEVLALLAEARGRTIA